MADTGVRSKMSLRLDCQLVQATELESKYWHEILRCMVNVTVFPRTQDLALRGYDKVIGSCHNGNFLDIIELLTKCDPFFPTHIEK